MPGRFVKQKFRRQVLTNRVLGESKKEIDDEGPRWKRKKIRRRPGVVLS